MFTHIHFYAVLVINNYILNKDQAYKPGLKQEQLVSCIMKMYTICIMCIYVYTLYMYNCTCSSLL